MAFNIFSTLNQNLQNFGGDAYDAYQAGKSKVGNVASTINTNLQDFGSDLYDAGSTIKKNVSNFGTQTYNQGKNVANTIQKNVGDYYEKGLKPIPGQAYDATIGRASKGFTDYAKGVIDYGREREASNVGVEDSKALKVMQAMKDEGYSKDEILAQMSQFDAEEKARKQQEWAQKQQSNYENASLGRKALAGSVNFVGGAEAGMMRLPAGVTDFVSGGTDYTKDTMQGINDFTSRSGAAKVGDIAGQIAATSIIPGIGKIAPKGSTIGKQFLQGAVPGAIYGGLTPIMQKGNEATLDEIGTTALQMGALGGGLNVGLMRGVPAIIKGTKSGIKAGQYTNGSISDKIGAGTQAFGKSIGRQTMKGTKEAIGSISSAYQNTKPFVKDTVKKPYQFTQDKVQSLLSNSSDKTKSTIAQTYGLENQEIGALRNMGEKGVSDAMKKMEAIDKTALEGGGVNSIYDDLHKEIMTGVGRRSKEISTLEAQKDKILQSSPVVVKQAELESIFDDVLKAQGIQRTQEMTKKGIKNVYTVVGEGNITKGDMANIEKLYNEVFRTKGDVSALNMNTRIKNLQGNLYNSDGAAVYGSNSMTGTAKSIVAKVNDLLKKKLPPEYGMAKEAQSKILQQRQVILKALKEEDNALALLSDDAIANMSEEAVVKLMNDSIAGNKMALVLRRLANSTTTGGDAKQLANIIKEFTGVDAESKAIALRAIAKLTGNQQIMNELGGLIEKGIMKGSLGFIRKTLAPSPDKVIKAVATKSPIVPKAKPKATKPPIVPKAKPKATTESAFKNNKGFINPSEIKKSLIPKKGADEARQFYDDLVYAGNSPIVAQRETAKRFGTIRAMSASKAGTFGGEGAKEAPKTGWFKGADGKMKFEIDDSKANFEFPKRTSNESRIQNAKANFETAKLDDVQIKDAMEIDGFKGTPKEYRDELIKHGYEDMYNIKSGNYRLGDILQHSDLYKQYPWLENTPVSFHTEGGMRSAGEMSNGKISIALNAKDPKSVILHEIQHIIQEKEGFARGGNPESFKQGIEYYKKLADYNRDILGDIRYDKMLEKDKTSIAYKKLVKEEEEALRTYKIANEKYKELSSTSPMESYNNQAGEVESRNVQTRMNMTAKERALKSPESTEDVPRLKQIVRLKNDGTSMSIDKAGTMDISKAPEALVQEARKYKDGEEFYQRANKQVRKEMKDKGIVYQSQYEDFFKKFSNGKENIIDSMNPTGGLLVDYTPSKRMTAKLAPNITTIDKTMGVSPDKMITIYRGAPKSQKSIVGGDFITTNKELAKQYAGDGHILETKVKASDILDDIKDPLGEEYLYRPNKTKATNKK